MLLKALGGGWLHRGTMQTQVNGAEMTQTNLLRGGCHCGNGRIRNLKPLGDLVPGFAVFILRQHGASYVVSRRKPRYRSDGQTRSVSIARAWK